MRDPRGKTLQVTARWLAALYSHLLLSCFCPWSQLTLNLSQWGKRLKPVGIPDGDLDKGQRENGKYDK